MSDLRSSFALILLIFSATFDQVRNEKTNCRRALGLVAYPRTGRSSEMTDFHRSARTIGFIHYPRTGRSNIPAMGASRKQDLGSSLDLEFLPARETNVDSTFDPDYEEMYPGSFSITSHAEKVYPEQKHINSRPYDFGSRDTFPRKAPTEKFTHGINLSTLPMLPGNMANPIHGPSQFSTQLSVPSG